MTLPLAVTRQNEIDDVQNLGTDSLRLVRGLVASYDAGGSLSAQEYMVAVKLAVSDSIDHRAAAGRLLKSLTGGGR